MHHNTSRVRLAEKGYYEQRRTKLQNLKNEFVKIKQNLENFCGLYGGEFVEFTYHILKQYVQHKQVQYYDLPLSQEINIPEQQYVHIRKVREAELAILEKDIHALQFTIGLHVNELIVELEKAVDDYAKITAKTNKEIDVWNMQRERHQITKAVALKSYEYDMLEEHLVNSIDQRIKEFKLIENFYDNHCSNAIYIKKGTNIFSVFQDRKLIIAEYEKAVTEDRTRIVKNIAAVDHYFASRGIAYAQLKNNIKNALKADQQNNNEQKVKDLANKRSGQQTPNGPKKDDDDKEDKDSGNKSKGDINKETAKIAEELGFRKTNYQSHGQTVFQKLNRFISRDMDVHNGGFWKMADSVKNLARKQTRLGTYDKFLNRIGD